MPNPPPNKGQFPTTQWTLLEKLHSPHLETAREALNVLCARYHFPLYCLIRHRGLGHHEAQDVLQEFLSKLLRLDAFQSMEEEKGRLRSFLAKSLKRFVITWQERQSRRLSREVLAEDMAFDLDADLDRRYVEHVADMRMGPDGVLDMQWCSVLLARVLARLEDLYKSRGKAGLFTALKPVLLTGGSLRDHDTAEIAAGLGMKEPAVRGALLRLLRSYRALLFDEVRQTVGSDEEAKEEIEHLMGQTRGGE